MWRMMWLVTYAQLSKVHTGQEIGQYCNALP